MTAENVTIRSARAEDADALAEIYARYVTDTAVSFELVPPDGEEFRRRIGEITKNRPYLVAEQNGVILGYAYAGALSSRPAYDHCVEVTVYLRQNARRMGLGRMLYGSLEAELKKRGIKNLYACIAVTDEPDEYLTNGSMHFHSRMGYTLCGTWHKSGCKFGRYYDVIWMEKFI